MKRFLFLFAVFAFTEFFCSAQVVNELFESQIVSAKEITVGDKIQLRYIFHSPVEILDSTDDSEIKADTFEYIFSMYEKDCSVKNVTLQKFGNDYALNMELIPWVCGTIDFMPFDLSELFLKSGLIEFSGIIIDIQSFDVSSVSEKFHSTMLQPPVAPILIAGTTYIIYGSIIILCVLFLLLCILLVHLPQVMFSLKQWKTALGYGHNAHVALKKLRRLSHDSSCTDAEFSKEIQDLTRVYLSYRFARPFGTYNTEDINNAFSEIGQYAVHISQTLRLEELETMFRRTDYIRYAPGSIDSKLLPPTMHDTVFLSGERETLILSVRKAIIYLENKPVVINKNREEKV